jgi:nitrogen regulatory protein P-II 1
MVRTETCGGYKRIKIKKPGQRLRLSFLKRSCVMKKIEAYIKEHRLDEVIDRLHVIEGLTGVSIHEIKGFGRTRGHDEPVRIVDNTINWIPHVKLEIFCCEEIKDRVIQAIVEGAHTGLRADGKIYVSPVEDAVRISTKEKGEVAI